MSRRKNGYVSPPHWSAEAHAHIMKELREMTREQFFQSLVDAGIYTPDRKLTPPYAPEKRTAAKKRKPSKKRKPAKKTSARPRRARAASSR